MTRRGGTLGRVALGIAAALLALPSIAAAQSAVDEYTLDIPGGGGSPSGITAFAWRRPAHDIPWRATLIVSFAAALAGVVMASAWIYPLVDYLKDP